MPCMLRTTIAFTLGMHAMALLARDSRRRLRVAQIAELCGASEAHVAKVIQALARNGLVRGERGPAGGIQMNGRPETISMMEVWDAIEGRSADGGCPYSIPSCMSDICSLGRVFEEHNRRIENLMKNTTLKDLDCMNEVWPRRENERGSTRTVDA